MAITKDDIKSVLKEYGVVTKKDLNKVKKELQESIARLAFNSPTSNQFNQLEKRVERVEATN